MFEFILTAYRRLQAAINREAAAIEDTAALRETLNASMREAMADRGILPPAPTADEVIVDHSTPTNRLANGNAAHSNGKKSKASA
jgi:hypothetical protein